MKKWTALLLALVICLSLCACRGKNQTADTAQTTESMSEVTDCVEEEIESIEDNSGQSFNILSTEYNISCFRNNYCVVDDGGNLFGVIDPKGNLVIDFEYDGLEFLGFGKGNLLLANKEGYAGLIAENGKVVIPLEYDDVYAYDDNCVFAKIGKQIDIYDFNGEKLSTLESVFEFNSVFDGVYSYRPIDATTNTAATTKYINSRGETLVVVNSIDSSAYYNPKTDSYYISGDEGCYSPLMEISKDGKLTGNNYDLHLLYENENTTEYYYRFYGFDIDGNILVDDMRDSYGYKLFDINTMMPVEGNEKVAYRTYSNFIEESKNGEYKLYDNGGNELASMTHTYSGEKYMVCGGVFATKEIRDANGSYINVVKVYDLKGEQILEDRYFDGAVVNGILCLLNKDNEVCLVSGNGDVLADYGIFDIRGMDGDDPYLVYQGDPIESSSITDSIISLKSEYSNTLISWKIQ